MRDDISFDEVDDRNTSRGANNLKKVLVWIVGLVVVVAAVYFFVLRGGGDEESSGRYNTIISEANAAYNQGKYYQARELYARALTHKPEDELAARRIVMVDSILAAAETIPEDTLQQEPEKQEVAQIDSPVEEEAPAVKPVTHDTEVEDEEADVPSYKFHVIVGSFEVESNAVNLSNELKASGINSTTIPILDGRMTAVTYNSFETKEEAVVELRRVQREYDKDAWILEYEQPARGNRLNLDPK